MRVFYHGTLARLQIGKYESEYISQKDADRTIHLGGYKSEKYNSEVTIRENTTREKTHRNIQVGKYKSINNILGNTDRKIQIGKHTSGNTDRTNTIRKIRIGKI